MARKKCKECLSCFEWFWMDNKRYYHCWLCNTTWEGRDDDLHQCEDPRIPKELIKNDNINNANS